MACGGCWVANTYVVWDVNLWAHMATTSDDDDGDDGDDGDGGGDDGGDDGGGDDSAGDGDADDGHDDDGDHGDDAAGDGDDDGHDGGGDYARKNRNPPGVALHGHAPPLGQVREPLLLEEERGTLPWPGANIRQTRGI